ncbi:ubiquitin-related domain-containing protein [Globomyces pollinis-pini]|nr:ubiquitin-related domain-containing protein [Globomyces pollinis-pini]
MVEQQGGSDEAKQPEVKSELHINVKVSSPDSEMYFKIKKTTPLAKLMNTYCERQGKPPGSIRFMLDGVRIENHNTPEELEMEDDDVIDAMITQVGGCL